MKLLVSVVLPHKSSVYYGSSTEIYQLLLSGSLVTVFVCTTFLASKGFKKENMKQKALHSVAQYTVFSKFTVKCRQLCIISFCWCYKAYNYQKE